MSSAAAQCNDEALFYVEILREGGQYRYNSNAWLTLTLTFFGSRLPIHVRK